MPHLIHYTPQSLFQLFSDFGLVPILFDSFPDVSYSSQAMIGQRATPASYGENTFTSALQAERAKFVEISRILEENIREAKNALIWGCGSDLYSVLVANEGLGTRDFILCDRSSFKIGKTFMGRKILKPEEAGVVDIIVIAVLDPRVASLIEDEAKLLFPLAGISSFVGYAKIRN